MTEGVEKRLIQFVAKAQFIHLTPPPSPPPPRAPDQCNVGVAGRGRGDVWAAGVGGTGLRRGAVGVEMGRDARGMGG